MADINFLRHQQIQIKQRARRQMLMQMSSFSLLVVFGIIVGLVFAYYFYLDARSKNLDQRIADQQNQIESLAGVETKQYYLKQKSFNLKTIFESARNHQAIVEGLFSIIPQGIEVKDFAISDKGDLILNGSCIDFAALVSLLDNLKKGTIGSQKVYASEMLNTSVKEKSGYDFNIKILLQPI